MRGILKKGFTVYEIIVNAKLIHSIMRISIGRGTTYLRVGRFWSNRSRSSYKSGAKIQLLAQIRLTK
jgi:hypothetical protein